MAKMKVHELAKELDRQSKELIAFLQDKGYEVKVAQSSIEDEAIALVRKQFGKAEALQAEEKKEIPVKEEAKPEEPKKEEVRKEEPKKSMTKPETVKEEPPKKKKIIFVSNPHNSKMPGQRSNQSQSGNGGNNGYQNRNNNDRRQNNNMNSARPVQTQNVPHKIIRPTQKPIPVTAEPYEVRQKQQQERRLEQQKQEKPAALSMPKRIVERVKHGTDGKNLIVGFQRNGNAQTDSTKQAAP